MFAGVSDLDDDSRIRVAVPAVGTVRRPSTATLPLRERIASRGRLCVGLVCFFFALAAITGCQGEPSSQPSTPTQPSPVSTGLAALFREMISTSESPFIKEVLSDYYVTDAEYAEARARNLRCLTEAGIDAWYEPQADANWSLAIAGEMTSAQQDQELHCSRRWMGPIWELYDRQRNNPENRDPFDLIAECLVREGFAPDGFTGRDYLEFIEEHPEDILDPADPGPTLPGGYAPRSAEASQACVW
jgi:hypothetical protein